MELSQKSEKVKTIHKYAVTKIDGDTGNPLFVVVYGKAILDMLRKHKTPTLVVDCIVDVATQHKTELTPQAYGNMTKDVFDYYQSIKQELT